jgi:hypothetical protein
MSRYLIRRGADIEYCLRSELIFYQLFTNHDFRGLEFLFTECMATADMTPYPYLPRIISASFDTVFFNDLENERFLDILILNGLDITGGVVLSAEFGSLEFARYFVERAGVDPFDGRQLALQQAAFYAQMDVLKYLISLDGADVSVLDGVRSRVQDVKDAHKRMQAYLQDLNVNYIFIGP